MPPIESIALPEERDVLNTLIAGRRATRSGDVAAWLRLLDQALVGLVQPTPFRGAVQMARSEALQGEQRYGEATVAIEESIRLLPTFSQPMLVAAELYAYSNRPQLAADMLIRAAEVDPAAARLVSDYDINNVMRRLDVVRDRVRLRRLGDRLLAIGWTGEGLEGRSRLAEEAIELAIDQGDLAHARLLVPDVVVPTHIRQLLMVNANRAIWPDLERWGGARLERQWPIYLDEARRRWEAGQDLARGRDYAQALRLAGLSDRLVATFLPLFAKPIDPSEYFLILITPSVANALMRQGKTDEAIALFDRAAKSWPLGSSANALNISANRAKILLSAGRTADALAKIDLSIADAHRWGPEVNADALAGMHQVRACTLHELHRDKEAAVSAAIAAGVGGATSAAMVHLCMDDPASAKDILIRGLSRPSERPSIIAFLQPDPQPAIPTDYGRRDHARDESLRADPELIAAIAPYGRILPFSVTEGVPHDPPRSTAP